MGMDWQLLKANGTWIEANSLPAESRGYAKAILCIDTNEVLKVEPVNGYWAVVVDGQPHFPVEGHAI